MQPAVIDVGLLVSIVSLIIGLAALILAWYVNMTRPKRAPRPHLVVIPSIWKTSPERYGILAQNVGDATAHNFSIYVRFPEGSEITLMDKGVFEIEEGGKGEHFVKFARAQMAPRTSLPLIYVSAQKAGVLVHPEAVFAECREMPKVPIQPIQMMA